MAKLIHIQTSLRGSRSAPRAVATRFIEFYCAAHPGDTVDTLDLWQTDLPEINGAMLDAAYAVKHGQPHSPEQLHVWQVIVRIADHLKSADKYLVLLPMWNFSIPYKLSGSSGKWFAGWSGCSWQGGAPCQLESASVN